MNPNLRVPPRVAWRLARRAYADLTGAGAQRVGGRWNSPGRPAVYLSLEASTPLLEILAHLDLPLDLLPEDYVLMKVDLDPPSVAGGWIERGPEAPLPVEDSRAHGDGWLAEARSPLLQVPSAIVAESANLVLNPRHPEAAAIGVAALRPFAVDLRLSR